MPKKDAPEEKDVSLDQLKSGIKLKPGHKTVLVVSDAKGKKAAGDGKAGGKGNAR